MPGATRLSLQYANTPGGGYPAANGLMIVGGLRGVTMPLDEVINDTRLVRKFTLGSQSHDVTVGYYFREIQPGL